MKSVGASRSWRQFDTNSQSPIAHWRVTPRTWRPIRPQDSTSPGVRGATSPPWHGARFPFELIWLPIHSVVASFDDDFRAFGRHDREQTITVYQAKTIEQFRPNAQRPGPLHLNPKQAKHRYY